MTIEEYSESRIGETWTEGDHRHLVDTMQQVTKLAQQAHDLQSHKRVPGLMEQLETECWLNDD